MTDLCSFHCGWFVEGTAEHVLKAGSDASAKPTVLLVLACPTIQDVEQGAGAGPARCLRVGWLGQTPCLCADSKLGRPGRARPSPAETITLLQDPGREPPCPSGKSLGMRRQALDQ